MEKSKKEDKKVEVFSLSGMITLKGFIKNGLDSSAMINLVVCFDSNFEEFRKRGFTFPPNLFYYHEISRSEVIGVLINRYNFTEQEAVDSWNKLVSEFNLTKIIRVDDDELYEKIVEEANEKVVKRENNEDLRIGEQDVIIIGGFLRDKVNCVHACDEGFEKTCKELGLNVIPLPKEDIKKEKEIQKWSKKK